ncbi:MAG: glycosyltransferase family 4 protein [Planctomycetaceae bacterium]
MARALSVVPDVRVVVVIRDSRVRRKQNPEPFSVVVKVDRLFRIRRFVSEHATVLRTFPWILIHKWHRNLLWQIPVLFLARFFSRRTKTIDDFSWLTESVDCDVYCCMGVSNRTAQVFDAAKRANSRTLLFIVSDADVDERYVWVPGFVNQHGDAGSRCAEAIYNADLIACQTDVQMDRLARSFKRESLQFPNPFDHDDWMQKAKRADSMPPTIPDRFALWIGRSDRHHKRPQILLRLARKCPDVRFVMVMNTHDESVAVDVHGQCPSNVVIVERIPFDEMPHYFERSCLFISTGSAEFEGFPNVFLQAAASGTPVVTLEADPGFIESHETGIVCHSDFEKLVSAVNDLWTDSSECRRLGLNGRSYLTKYHSATSTRERMLSILKTLSTSSDCTIR